MFISYGGDIQRWGFTFDEIDRAENPPPFLYDQLKPFPFWPVWVLLIFPLIGLDLPIAITTIGGAIFSVGYFYFLSSVIVHFLRMVKKTKWFDESPHVKL